VNKATVEYPSQLTLVLLLNIVVGSLVNYCEYFNILIVNTHLHTFKFEFELF